MGFGQIAAGQHQVAVAGNHGQQIVEIVGDAARQAAHRLHFLGLPELLLEPGSLAAHFGRAKLPLDGGVEAHQVGASKMIGRPGRQSRQDIGLPDASGDHDQRKVGGIGLNDAQGLERPEIPHLEVADSDIPGGEQGVFQLLAGGYELKRGVVPAPAQLAGHGIGAGEADEEYPEGLGHDSVRRGELSG